MKRSALTSGFTLIELMVVVAVIAVLAAIAVPAYKDYIVRTRVTELINVGAALKPNVVEYYTTHGTWPTSIAQAGASDMTSTYVEAVAISPTV